MSGAGIKAVEAQALAGRPLRHFDYAMAAFVTILLLSTDFTPFRAKVQGPHA